MTNTTLFSIAFLIILTTSCAPLTLVPTTETVVYENNRTISLTEVKNSQLKINFEGSNRDYFVYNISITNLSEQPLSIAPTDFHYLVNNERVQFKALSYHAIMDDTNYKIEREKNYKNGVEIVQTVVTVSNLATEISNINKEETKEERLERQLNYENHDNAIDLHKDASANQVIALYELKDYLDRNYMRSVYLGPNEVYSGLVYFPRFKNNLKDNYKIIYTAPDKSQHSIPFNSQRR